MTMHRFKTLLPIALLLSAAACGGGENDAPVGSTITITPAKTARTASGGTCQVYGVPVFITIKNAAGTPLNGARIAVYLDLSLGAVAAGNERMALFDGASGPLPFGYTTETGDNGTKALTVKMNTTECGATYTGQLAVQSGAISQSADFSMQATQ